MSGLNERIINEDALYYEDETVPQNATISSSAIRTGAGGQIGATKVLFRVNTAVSIADTEIITYGVQDSADGTTDWVTISSKALTSSGATVYLAGEEQHEFILPRTVREFTRVQITTDDVAATGSVDVFCSTAVGIGKY